MSDKLSEYSLHFRNMSEQDARDVASSMDGRRIEKFRLRLDVERILPLIKGPDVLDMPFGIGRLTPYLIGRFNNFGYEISASYVAFARERYPQIAGHFRVCGFEDIDRERKFDTVISLRVLERIKDMPAVAINVSSVLKPNGRWIFNYAKNGPRYADISQILSSAGMTVTLKRRYDFHTGMALMSKPEQAFYDRFRAAIERGWIPYWMFRCLEALYFGRGTYLFVAEKTAETPK